MEINTIRDQLLSYKGQNLSHLYTVYGLTVNSNKGKFGQLIEKILGLKTNSLQTPDFGDFELKCIPLKRKKNGELTYKETVAITMINPNNIIENTFIESHLYDKLKKVLFVTYIEDTIHGVHIYEMDSIMFNEIQEDYDLVKQSIISDGMNSLSGKMGKHIQPRTKGAGHGSKSRAFYGRTSFLSKIITL